MSQQIGIHKSAESEKGLTSLPLIKRNYLFLFVFCFLSFNGFIIYFIGQEHYVYFWDYSGYWNQYKDLSNLFRHSPIHAVKALITSIRYDDYNSLPVLFLVPFNFIFGDSRLAYVLSITNLFVLPTVVAFGLLMEKIVSIPWERRSFAVYFISILTAASFPHLWIPVVLGKVDISGMLVINLILLFYIDKPVEKQGFVNLLLIGTLLCILILLRRWYAYWVVAFFVSMTLERIVSSFREYRFKIGAYLPFLKIVIIGVFSVLLFFLIAGPVAKRMLLTNYADIYSAYKTSKTTGQAFLRVCSSLGIFFISLAFMGLVKSLGGNKTRRLSFFLLILLIVTFFLFSRTQDFATQHYYLLIPTVLIYISFLLVSLYRILNGRASKIIFLVVCFVLLSINFSVVFFPKAPVLLKRITYLLPQERSFPLVRTDLDQIHSLINVLNTIAQTNRDNIYVMSSSTILNDDILRNACNEDKRSKDMCGRIQPSSNVDKRDGFPFQFLTARYVVVADPVQYHLSPDDQRVIGIPAEMILHQKEIGSSYKRLSYAFTLDNDVRVFIYEKIKPFSGTDLDNLSKMFISYYPDKEDIFRIDHVLYSQ